jgi:CRP-like cAMP-binding protein
MREVALAHARNTGWGSRLPAPTQQALLAVARLRTLTVGARLFSIGDPQGPMFFVASGCIAAEVAMSVGSANKAMLLYPGAWFAEGPTTLTDRAVGFFATRPSTVLLIDHLDVRRVAAVYPDLWRFIALLNLENHRRTMGLAHDLMIRGGRRRFAAVLARMAGLREEVVPDPPIIDATQAEVGAMVNLARSVVSAFLKEMEREGILRLNWASVEVLRPDLLLQMSEKDD